MSVPEENDMRYVLCYSIRTKLLFSVVENQLYQAWTNTDQGEELLLFFAISSYEICQDSI